MTDRPWVLITGGAQRLGRAVALKAAAGGWSVAIQYRNSANEAVALVGDLHSSGADAVAVRADLTDDAAVAALLAQAQRAASAPITALVNAAAMFAHDTIDGLDRAAFAMHMHVNAFAPSLLAKQFAAEFTGQAGAIVNFLDFKLAQPYPDHFSYTLSKYALAGATELLARALAPRIRVNAVAPGYVLPAPGQPQADFERLHADTPLQRGTTQEDVANAVLFLLENPAITGQTLFVDSGLRFVSRERDLAYS